MSHSAPRISLHLVAKLEITELLLMAPFSSISLFKIVAMLIIWFCYCNWASLVDQIVKNLPAVWETRFDH